MAISPLESAHWQFKPLNLYQGVDRDKQGLYACNQTPKNTAIAILVNGCAFALPMDS